MNLQSLLESANPYTSVQNDAARLASKWEKTGLLDKLTNESKGNMAMILESQAKQLVIESSQTGGGIAGASFTAGVGEQWAGVALPLVRKIFGQISCKEFLSVQPLKQPAGLAFFLDFQYGNTKSHFTAGQSLYGDQGGNAPFGNTNTGGFYGAGRFGYTTNVTSSAATATVVGTSTWADLNFNGNYSASFATYKTVTVPTSSLPNFDANAVRAFGLSTGSISGEIQVNEFTKLSGGTVQFIISGSVVPVTASIVNVDYSLQPVDNSRGDYEDKNDTLNGNNSPIVIPEINIQMRSTSITVKTKKLKAVWTPEFTQDLNAYQNADAEAEVTSVISEYISLEIDLELLEMLMTNANAGTEYWSAVNNAGINGTNTGFTENLGFYNSQGQWFQTLGTKIQKLSNKIHQKTLRNGANFLVCSPDVGTILESIPGFASDSDGDVSKQSYAFGITKGGSLSGGRLKVYKNPYMTENQILLGFRGAQFLESGAVFAPYIPLIMTPLVYDPDTYTPSKGLLTRFGKKMLRPEFYGIIKVAGLNTL